MDRRYVDFCRPDMTFEEEAAAANAVGSGWLTQGRNVAHLEEEFAHWCGCERPGVAVDSCTSALFLALTVLGLAGKRVAVSSITFAASANMIVAAGATPLFVDVDHTGCLDPADERLLQAEAIMAVHYAGKPCDLPALARYGVPVIEDAAEAHGAFWRRQVSFQGDRMCQTVQRVGTAGNLTCFSFYPTKIIAGAEGGMIVGQSEEQDTLLRQLRLHGLSRGAENRYTDRSSANLPEVEMLGWKMNLNDPSAAIIRRQLIRSDGLLARRHQVWDWYEEALVERDLPYEFDYYEGTCPAPYIFVCHVPRRDEFVAAMLQRGVKCGVHFTPLHRHPYYRAMFPDLSLPRAERWGATCVSLPFYPTMSQEEVCYVADCMALVLEELS